MHVCSKLSSNGWHTMLSSLLCGRLVQSCFEAICEDVEFPKPNENGVIVFNEKVLCVDEPPM